MSAYPGSTWLRSATARIAIATFILSSAAAGCGRDAGEARGEADARGPVAVKVAPAQRVLVLGLDLRDALALLRLPVAPDERR